MAPRPCLPWATRPLHVWYEAFSSDIPAVNCNGPLFDFKSITVGVQKLLTNIREDGTITEKAPQFHLYLPCLGAYLALCLNSVLNVKPLEGQN